MKIAREDIWETSIRVYPKRSVINCMEMKKEA